VCQGAEACAAARRGAHSRAPGRRHGWRAWRVSSAGPGQDGVAPTRRRSALGGRVVGGPDLPSASGYRTPGRARRGLQRPGAPPTQVASGRTSAPKETPGQLLGALALRVAISPISPQSADLERDSRPCLNTCPPKVPQLCGCESKSAGAGYWRWSGHETALRGCR
jgi:hypothetical protein